MKFRKKPVLVEARLIERSLTSKKWYDLADWCGGEVKFKNYELSIFDCIDIPTLEGTMRASIGDWIIQGVKGEFYPCKPDIFGQTYEMVTEPKEKL